MLVEGNLYPDVDATHGQSGHELVKSYRQFACVNCPDGAQLDAVRTCEHDERVDGPLGCRHVFCNWKVAHRHMLHECAYKIRPHPAFQKHVLRDDDAK